MSGLDGYLTACFGLTLTVGLVSGVFLAFSDFIMKALAASSPSSAVEAMQRINRKVYGSAFIALLTGAAAVCLLLSGYAVIRSPDAATYWLVAGSAVYLTGVLLVTIVFNVPMNQKLDGMQATAPDTWRYWTTYQRGWTLWNHVRTTSSIASTACLMISCIILTR